MHGGRQTVEYLRRCSTIWPLALTSPLSSLRTRFQLLLPHSVTQSLTALGVLMLATFNLSSSSNWVDTRSYYGPNRRATREAHHNGERRVRDAAGHPPSFWSAFRKLRFHVLGAYGKAALDAFIDRTEAVALLADHNGEFEISETLTDLALKLSASPPGRDMRSEIYTCLGSISPRDSYGG